MDYEQALRVLGALERKGVRYAVFGGAVQYVPPTGSFHLDLVTRLGEAFRFQDLETERIRFGDLTVTVVSPRTLYRMKKDTVRLQDRADAEILRKHFDLEEG